MQNFTKIYNLSQKKIIAEGKDVRIISLVYPFFLLTVNGHIFCADLEHQLLRVKEINQREKKILSNFQETSVKNAIQYYYLCQFGAHVTLQKKIHELQEPIDKPFINNITHIIHKVHKDKSWADDILLLLNNLYSQ